MANAAVAVRIRGGEVGAGDRHRQHALGRTSGMRVEDVVAAGVGARRGQVVAV
jgi:hypothetical protein